MNDLKKDDIVRVNGLATKIDRVFKVKGATRISLKHGRETLTFEKVERPGSDFCYWRYTKVVYGSGYSLETERQFLVRDALARSEKEVQKVQRILRTAYEAGDLQLLNSILSDVVVLVETYKKPEERSK